MAEITAAIVKAFRDKTGLPMMDCKRALEEAGGDEEKAPMFSPAPTEPAPPVQTLEDRVNAIREALRATSSPRQAGSRPRSRRPWRTS